MVRALVVAVLEDLRQRELEDLLVDPDGLLDVMCDHGEVVQAARARPGAALGGLAVIARPVEFAQS